ncbi:hypothetical protein ElyMa_002892900 [Elysia marginata]|uniref:C-type lectin domain-containing protein n=1 Tax=Elysia marginata TaxID=1093978 RepID=A0AAV4I231_9GAST|nr:hypothetical protein ElyMa_002892900 [Elysia marginata]
MQSIQKMQPDEDSTAGKMEGRRDQPQTVCYDQIVGRYPCTHPTNAMRIEKTVTSQSNDLKPEDREGWRELLKTSTLSDTATSDDAERFQKKLDVLHKTTHLYTHAKFVFFVFGTTSTFGNGELFDYYALNSSQTFHDGEILCQNLGYDGLAVIGSTEMFAHAYRFAEYFSIGLYTGLRNNTETNLVTWDDGTALAEDLSWEKDGDEKDFQFIGRHFGRLTLRGNLKATTGRSTKLALCGNRTFRLVGNIS